MVSMKGVCNDTIIRVNDVREMLSHSFTSIYSRSIWITRVSGVSSISSVSMVWIDSIVNLRCFCSYHACLNAGVIRIIRIRSVSVSLRVLPFQSQISGFARAFTSVRTT